MSKSNWLNSPRSKARVGTATKRKSRNVALLLAFFLGGFGVHKFYQGKLREGLLYLLFCWTLVPVVFALIDLFFIPGQIRLSNSQLLLRNAAATPESHRNLSALTQVSQLSKQLEIVLKLMFGILAAWLIYVSIASSYHPPAPKSVDSQISLK